MDYKKSELPYEYEEYLEVFHAIKSICGDSSNPITPDLIRQWEDHTYRKFERWERNALLATDAAFRQALNKVIQWHQKRPQIKMDPDLKRMSSGGRGNSRL